MNKELETTYGHKKQLKPSKSSYNELVTQHMALEDKFKSMESAAKLTEERPDSS